MNDELFERASRVRNRVSQLKMLLDKNRTPQLVRVPEAIVDSNQRFSGLNLYKPQETILSEETMTKLDTLVREELTEKLRVAQEEYDAI